MALAALAGERPPTRQPTPPTRRDVPWIRLLQHRFGGNGALAGHAVGNLLLAGLMEVLDDPVAALDEVGALVGARGRVLPMACEPLDIEAEVTGLEDDDPRARTASAARSPSRPPPAGCAGSGCCPTRPQACAEAVAAVRSADAAAARPGLLVHQRAAAPAAARAARRAGVQPARRVIVLNLAPEPGETAGFSPEQHLAVLAEHAPELRVDAVLADIGAVPVPDRLHRAAAGCSPRGAGRTWRRSRRRTRRRRGTTRGASRTRWPPCSAGPTADRARRRREPGGDAGRDEQGGRHGVYQQRR